MDAVTAPEKIGITQAYFDDEQWEMLINVLSEIKQAYLEDEKKEISFNRALGFLIEELLFNDEDEEDEDETEEPA